MLLPFNELASMGVWMIGDLNDIAAAHSLVKKKTTKKTLLSSINASITTAWHTELTSDSTGNVRN